MICGFLMIGNAVAESIYMRAHIIQSEARGRAVSRCDQVVETVQYPDKTSDEPAREIMREQGISVSWTGGCAGGKRDGRGVLTIRTQDSIGTVSTEQLEGAFIKGRQLGLWCITRYELSINGQPYRTLNPTFDLTGCVVHAPGAPKDKFRKLVDGRWKMFAHDGAPVEPQVFLAAGTLETLSANALAGATGATVAKTKVVAQSQTLDGLVRGAKIELQSSPTPILLKGKRVAVVLSSQTIAELERFKRERQALIDASVGIQGKEAQAARARFIAASNPDRLLTIVAKALRKHARDVQPLDDLASLKESGFDYALVVDWKSLTRFDLLGKYDSFPGGDADDMGAGTVPTLAGESLSGILINPDLKAVQLYTTKPNIRNKFKHTYRPDDEDEEYISNLRSFFEAAWGENVDDLGSTGEYFDERLKAEY